MNLAPRELPNDEYRWWRENLLAFDCQANAFLGGWHHETLSSRSWRAWVKQIRAAKLRLVIDALFIWQSWRMDHCERHYNAEVARAELIVKVRSTWHHY